MRTASHSIAAEAAPTLVTLPARSASPAPGSPDAAPASRRLLKGALFRIAVGMIGRAARLPRAHIAAPLPRFAPVPGLGRVGPLSRAGGVPRCRAAAMRSDARSPRSARVVARAVRAVLPFPLRFRWTDPRGLCGSRDGEPPFRPEPFASACVSGAPPCRRPVPGAWRTVTSRSLLLQFPSDDALPGVGRQLGTRPVPWPSSGAGGMPRSARND
jgi:hypothetical protein